MLRVASPNDSAALTIVNSAALQHKLTKALSNQDAMKTVEEVRRMRLAELKSEFGSFAAINARIERLPTDSTLSQIANSSLGSKTGKPKVMGSDQARLLEEKLDKPRGWMDTDPDLLKGTSFSKPMLGEALGVVADALSKVPLEKRQALVAVLSTYAANPQGEQGSLAYLRSELTRATTLPPIVQKALEPGLGVESAAIFDPVRQPT